MKNTISKRCAEYKFESQAGAYFKHSQKFSSIAQLHAAGRNLEEETFCLVTDLSPPVLHLDGFFLCEALSFPSERTYSLTAIKRKGCLIDLTLPVATKQMKPNALSISLICTEDKLYTDFLQRSIQHYNKVLKDVCNFEISVAYFGTKLTSGLSSCRLKTYSPKDFHMAFARKESLKECMYDTVLMLDLDCYLSKEQIQSLLHKFAAIPHHGVFNLKQNFKSGNGLYLGTKQVLLENDYNEDFKDFWFEDTEYLMNFSRRGIIPSVEFVDFVQVNHDRIKTISKSRRYQQHNRNLFEKILKHGR